MTIEVCHLFNIEYFSFECVKPNPNATKYFGFSEIISGLALTLVVWTVADLRYKFRIDTAAIPVRKVSVVVTLLVGFLTLLNDYWRASAFRVPVGIWLSPEAWQLFLGGGFFLVLAVGIWVAFFKPTKFCYLNASRLSGNVEMYLLRGSPNELAIVGNELTRSVSQIVKYAPGNECSEKPPNRMQKNAIKLLLAMASPKFCRAAVEGSPEIIIGLFNAALKHDKYNVEVEVFAKNIVTAAIANKNSFLYNEQDFFESGWEGLTRPVTTALCQSPAMVENIDTLLSPEHSSMTSWDISQWAAYFRLVLEAFSMHVGSNADKRPSSLHWAWMHVNGIYSDLNKNLKLEELKINDDLSVRLREIGDLIKKMADVLNELEEKEKKYADYALKDIAQLIFSLIKAASSVRSPRRISRRIQCDLIWGDILNSRELRGRAGCKILEIVHLKLQKAIVSSPNVDGVQILGYCINVMGFRVEHEESLYGSSWRKLHNWLIDWVRREISSLLKKYPSMASYCFVDGFSYDKENSRLVNNYAEGEEVEGNCEYLEVSPATQERLDVKNVNEACENCSEGFSFEHCSIYGAAFVLCWIGLLRMRKKPLP